jgi:hypothetical protein
MGGRLRARSEGRIAAVARAQQTAGRAGLIIFARQRLAMIYFVFLMIGRACGPRITLRASAMHQGRGRKT